MGNDDDDAGIWCGMSPCPPLVPASLLVTVAGSVVSSTRFMAKFQGCTSATFGYVVAATGSGT